MASGSISTLGVGSGLELQSILDQLREVDEKQRITPLKNKTTTLTSQIEAFTVVKNNLLSMRSHALTLSLESTFLGRTVASSAESVLTATVSEGASAQQTTITVDQLASKSSWLSSGLAAESSIVYVPTSQESTSGVADPDVDVVLANGDSLTIEFGESDSFTVTAGADLTLNELVTAINGHVDNVGGGDNGRLVTAETYTVGTDTYLRIKTDTTGGTGESHRVALGDNDSTLEFSPPNEVFQYEFGPTGDTTVVTLTVAADTTLSELVEQINSDTDNPGVTASIIDSGDPSDPYKLLLQADDTGEDNRITITSEPPDIAFTEQNGAAAASLNAKLSIDGIDYQRQSNSGISDILTGVTLKLQSAGSSTITVESNTDSLKTLITDLVTAYNTAVQDISSKVSYDSETKEFGVLSRTTVRDLRFDLQNLMTTVVRADSSGAITTLFDLGMEFEQDGTITLDTDVLDTQLAAYADEISEFFLGDSDNDITGFADTVNERLRVLTSGTGQIESEKTSAQERIDDLELKIESESERLERRYAILTKQFIELDRYMNQMTSMSNFLTGQFNSLAEGWGSSSKS